MPRILEQLRTEGSLSEATEEVRQAPSNSDVQAATEALRQHLQDAGILCTHSVFSAMSVRLLRSGATRQTEELAIALLDRWDALEEQLGVEVEPRLLAELVAGEEVLTPLLPAASVREQDDPSWRSTVYQSLLWSRGSDVRALALRPYHPYADLLPTDRRLVLDGLQDGSDDVSVLRDEWRRSADAELRRRGHVDLTAPADRQDALADALDSYLFDAVEMGYLHLHPRLVRISRTQGGHRATLVLEEVAPA
jgi:hypothetical protein